jgi:riboflavin synthase
MFTGIIEARGLITKITESGSNRTFIIESELANQLKIDQSIAHNGVCLTVESTDQNSYKVTAIQETLDKTTLGSWKTGQSINLEQCLQWNGRLDGHLVQGHVDAIATCISKKAMNGSWEFRFQFPKSFEPLVIEKGSICLDGISLTIFNINDNEFSVAIIPYTFEHTNLQNLLVGNSVNVEFDVIGKYVSRYLGIYSKK